MHKQPVRGYVFATQGLDLAIPLASEYLEKVTKRQIDYKQCPPSMTDVRFVHQQQDASANDDHAAAGAVRIKCHTSPSPKLVLITDENLRENLDDDTSLWYAGDTLEESEALCARTACKPRSGPKARQEFFPSQVAAAKVGCRTRILAKGHESKGNKESTSDQQPPNLLLLMIDPLSRSRFERSLVKTKYLLSQLNFTSFTSYTAVGNNSGPNQAALYSGQPLKSRNSISNHTREWLWDTLRKEGGYATLKAEDGCIENSNMLQSIKPQVDHGDAFNRMMCFDFQRPNCLGGKRAAEHLVEYGAQFMTAYSKLEKPWAGFLHLIDSHEDTQTLEGTLDDILFQFLFSIYNKEQLARLPLGKRLKLSIPPTVWNNTVIVLMSDHGLHYGSYLQSPQGLKERSQPLFTIHLPSTNLVSPDQLEALKHNKHLVTTPYDVYQTILDLLVPKNFNVRQSGEYGSSLVQRLPEDRKSCASVPVIPSQACELVEGTPRGGNRLMIPNPPSALSFYADIHPNNKPALETLGEQNSTSHLFHQTCQCATNRRPWYNCSSSPWSTEEIAKDKLNILSETFIMIECPDSQLVEVQVKPDPTILNRPYVIKAKESGLSQLRPNILWIEIDSVSRAYADRHFPKTKELLRRFRLKPRQKDSSEGEVSSLPSYECNSTKWCSADFSEFAVAGPNSIPNQVAAFGGCIVTTGPENCEELNQHGPHLLCGKIKHPVHGMQLMKRYRNAQTWCKTPKDLANQTSPWIFNIAMVSGYVNLFAEEFCYDKVSSYHMYIRFTGIIRNSYLLYLCIMKKSPFVSQGNMFDLSADILPHQLFCRDTERKMIRKTGKVGSHLWRFDGSTDPNIPGIDGPNSFPKANVSLDAIRSMYNAYPDTPKFAYLNAMAAHVYAKYPT